MLKKLLSLLLFLVMVSVTAMGADKFTLVIDAGHGGKDAGAVGAISKEKDINLKVALAFGRYVEQNCPEVKVIYTRKTDKFVELMERASIANRNKADLFVSIHTNAVAKGKSVRGFETYTLGMHRAADNLEVAKRENAVITQEANYQSKYQGFDPSSPESYIIFEYLQDKNMENSVNFAKYIQSSVCSAASRLNKGVHQAGFLVLRETSMPSCLVELGFISNPEEERQLNNGTVQDQMARGLYKAFAEYLKKYSSIKAASLAPAKVENQQVAESRPSKEVKDSKVSQSSSEEKDVAFVPVSPKVDIKAEQKSEKKAEPKTEKKSESKVEKKSETEVKAEPAKTETKASLAGQPVFKIQIASGTNKLKPTDSRFKGLANIEHTLEKGVYKYTYGSSTNYNDIYALRKTILDKFPEAFIIAFKDGEKMNVNEAIKEWKANRNKK